MKNERPRILAVLVNFFKSARLCIAVESLLKKNPDVDFQVVIVDNSCSTSEKATIENLIRRFPNVKGIYPERNLGYARGVNVAISIGEPDRHVLLVSPDVISERDTVGALLGFLSSDSSLGIVAPLQHNDDSSVVEVPRKFPNLVRQIERRIFARQDHVQSPSGTDLVEADWLQSSFVLIRRAVWDQIGGLNERYFLFMADTEFCLRCWEIGYRVVSINSIQGLRADGIRASGTRTLKALGSRAVRMHIKDSVNYYLSNGWRSRRREASCD